MSKQEGLSRRSGTEKSEMDGQDFEEEELLDLKNVHVREEEDVEAVELAVTDVAT